MSIPRRIGIAVLSLCLSYTTFFGIFTLLNPRDTLTAEAQENHQWIATSHSWVDRTTCKWAGMCGVNHWRSRLRMEQRLGNPWHDAGSQPSKWSHDERRLREIPQYVFDYAPLVHLFSDEQFWPCDIADHLHHVTPKLNYTSIQEHSPSLTELDQLNEWNRGRFVYLTSDDDPEQIPEWLSGKENIPEKSSMKDEVHRDSDQWDGRVMGEVLDSAAKREGWYEAGEGASQKILGRDTRPLGAMDDFFKAGSVGEALHQAPVKQEGKAPLKRQMVGGRSNAPAVLIVVNKGNGIVDAFWFYFYSFNLGNEVLNIRFGNHVGDWEHSMVRFQHGKPKAVYFSEHNFGSAYSYDAVEKIGKRPVVYSATGTHAMYAATGIHTYVLPFGLLRDQTDRGPLWDPLLNSHTYKYDYKSDVLRSSTTTPYAPTQWFHFAGHWGDKFYQLSDNRQYRFAGQYHYVNGPLGPRFKNLGRKKVCGGRDSDPCEIKNWIEGSGKPTKWDGVGEGESYVD